MNYADSILVVHKHLVTSLALVCCLMSAQASADKLQSLLTRAQQAVQANELQEALKLFKEASTLAPNNTDTHIKVGVLAVNLGHLQQGLDAFHQALRTSPKNTDALYNLGKLLSAIGRHAAALPHLKRAVKLNPTDPAIRTEHVSTLIALGKHKEARKLLPDLTRDHVSSYALLVLLELREMNWAAAVNASTRLLAHEPRAISSQLLFANTLIHNGDLKKADEHLKRLIQQAPATLSNIPYSLALSAFLQGRFSTAHSWMAEARSRAPGVFDQHSKAFNPQLFPTAGELSFLDWAGSSAGPNRAREASLSELKVSGKHCHAAPIMHLLSKQLVAFERCLGKSPNSLHMKALHRRHIRGISIKPRGAPAHCVQGLVNKLSANLPSKARCSFSVTVSPAQ